jgi:hypothetical protein
MEATFSSDTCNDQQIAFCQVGTDEEGKILGSRWYLPLTRLPADMNIHGFVKCIKGFEYEKAKLANKSKQIGIACFFRDLEVGEPVKLSSLSVGRSLKERTCIICIYDKSYLDLKDKLYRTLSTMDLESFLAASFANEFGTYFRIVDNFTTAALGMRYEDLARQSQSQPLPEPLIKPKPESKSLPSSCSIEAMYGLDGLSFSNEGFGGEGALPDSETLGRGLDADASEILRDLNGFSNEGFGEKGAFLPDSETLGRGLDVDEVFRGLDDL